MSDPILIAIFLFIVFAPCLAAWGGTEFSDGKVYVDKWQRPRRRGQVPVPLQAWMEERELSEDFEIRSFAKGISQRRLVVQDDESSVKLTISQVREAAVELIKLGGMIAAHEFALVAARSAAAMKSVKNAFAIAAHEAMEAARNAHAWLAWGDSMSEENMVWEAPPPITLTLPPLAATRHIWREATQAA